MTNVLQQLDLRLSCVAAHIQYVHDLQRLILHLLLTDKNLLSLMTLVRAGDTGTSLQSLHGSACPVWSGGADTNLHTLQSFCSGSAALVLEHLHTCSNCHLYDG